MTPPEEHEDMAQPEEVKLAESASAPPANGLLAKLASLHWLMIATILVLIAFGLFAIKNAADGRGPAFEVIHWTQLRWVGLGACGFIVGALIDYRWLRWAAWPLFGLTLTGQVLLRSFGEVRSGARSWLVIGDSLTFQPSYLAIFSAIVVLAIVLSSERLPNIVKVLLAIILVMVPAHFILREPDLGMAAVLVALLPGILLASSIPLRYLIALFLICLCLPPCFYFNLNPYQQDKIDRCLEMLINAERNIGQLQGAGWVPHHLLLAVGSAGFEGKGPFSKKVQDQASIHRTFFPHEATTDFISGVCAEEFGFRGMLMLISGLLFLLLQCVFVAFYARDPLGRLVVIGVTSAMMTYIFMNIGMNLLLVPITGLPLPFISYGGTFMVVVLFMFGLVQSVWVHRHISPATKPGERERRE